MGIVIASELPIEEIAFKDKEGCIIQAAGYLRQDIISFCEKVPELSWPPSLDELSNEERASPRSITLFHQHLLNNSNNKKKVPDSVIRKMNAMASDMITAVSKGEFSSRFGQRENSTV